MKKGLYRTLLIIGILAMSLLSYLFIKYISNTNINQAYLNACGYDNTYTSAANILVHDNFNEMYDSSDLVVMGYATGNKEHILRQTDSELALNMISPLSGHTRSEFNVKKVLKGDNNYHNVISILEPIVVVDDAILTIYDYTQLIGNAYYLLFLTHSNEENGYYTRGVYQGKLNLDGTDLCEATVFKRTRRDQRIKREAFKRFRSEINELLGATSY